MGIKKWILFLLVLSYIIPQVTLTNSNNASSPKSIIPYDEPLENSSLPFLELSDNKIDLGSEITTRFGMRNQSVFYAGYQYSLYLGMGNYTSDLNYNLSNSDIDFLKNGTTIDTFETLKIQTISGLKILLHTGIYTVTLQVNSTRRGLLNESKSFEIIAKPEADLKVNFVDENEDIIENGNLDMKSQETRTIFVKLINIGSNPAVNISLTKVGGNEPVGLFNSSINNFFDVIPVGDDVNISFSVRPANWGIGQIFIDIEYSDALGNNQATSKTFTTRVLPSIEGEIQYPSGRFDWTTGSSEVIRIKVLLEYMETT
ncbi:MAG: hypothetical protein ACXAD7_25325, partial [Candidatus Kariarchaeaceae archaeon]